MAKIIKRRASLMLTAAALLTVCGAMGFAVRAYNSRIASPALSPGEATRQNIYAAAQPQIPDEGVEAEALTLRPNGFEPNQITRPRGPFLLAVYNRARLESMSLRLNRVTDQREHQVPIPRGRSRWNHIFDLPPGDYVLTEAEHPEWACKIRITPR